MATESSKKKKLLLEATCSLCLEYFADPVTLNCGHVFCHDCITKSWNESSVHAVCPQCKEALPQLIFKRNRRLDNVVRLLKELSERDGGGKICEMHQERSELFCKTDQAFMCSVCDRSKEHQTHNVLPVEEAAQEFKGRMEKVKVTIESQFHELHCYLYDQEDRLLSEMEEIEEEMEEKRNEHADRISQELTSLEEIIWELEEKCQQPASELLQDADTTLQRFVTKEMFSSPVVYPPALKWDLWEVCDFSATLENVARQVKANVTLDPNTAHPKLVLSEDCKSLRLGDKALDLVNSGKRFDQCLFALGREAFMAGRHYWEVVVGSKDGWGLGVARSSVKRKGIVSLSPADGIWAMAKWGDQCAVLVPPDFPSLLVEWELKRIRVCLNYEGRQLAFLDADRGTLLYAFSGTSFSGEPLHPFFWLQRKAQLSLSP
ncbi:zinc finger protein RFP-like [Elgaria multicarinata webbii]|uniref:zinc finger protein RFP-like n=1 Tax=Elgaria multicarinata webbii TaxID=159646 RepID=UPI002FCCC095